MAAIAKRMLSQGARAMATNSRPLANDTSLRTHEVRSSPALHWSDDPDTRSSVPMARTSRAGRFRSSRGNPMTDDPEIANWTHRTVSFDDLAFEPVFDRKTGEATRPL